MKIRNEGYEGPWVQIGIDTPIRFNKKRKVIFKFEGYRIIWFNGNKEYFPFIAIPIKNVGDYSKEVEIGSRFLSVLAYRFIRPIRRLGGYSAGHGFTRYPRKLGDHIFPVPAHDSFRLPTRKEKRLALALYREGLDYHNSFYAFLSLYKIFEIYFRKNTEAIKNWINNHVDKVRDPMSFRRLGEIRKINPDIGDYLYKSERCAVAHAQSAPIIDPDETEDYFNISKDRWLLQDLAKIFIDSGVFD